jgi:putative heme-binding domain-containing protein
LGQDFNAPDSSDAAEVRKLTIQNWTEQLRQRFPTAAQQYLRTEKEEQARVQEALGRVPWGDGQLERGKLLFQKHSCSGCHNARAAVGPDLTGVAKRFSRDDLFTALLFPNRDVSPRYHTTLVETASGKILSGLVIYESAEGLTLRDSTNQTIRVEAAEIDVRRDLPTSLMPDGLLETLQPQELADLYAYLQTL